MRKAVVTICLVLAISSSLKAESQEIEISASGPFVLIQKKVAYSPLEVMAIRKSVITSFTTTGKDILIRTSEMEITYDNNDKQHIKRERYLKYSLNLKDEIEAKRIFDILTSLTGSE